jgi:hypothetical protein
LNVDEKFDDDPTPLSATDLASKAVGDFWRACGLMWPLFLSTLVIVGLLNLIGAFAKLDVVQLCPGCPRRLAPILLLAALVLAWCAVAPMAVAIHRLILLNEASPRSARSAPFALWFLGIQCVAVLVMVPLSLSGVNWLGFTFYVAIFLRIVLLFPAVAIDEPTTSWTERIRTSWRRTQGHFWTILFAEFLEALPITLVAAVPYAIGMFLLLSFDERDAQVIRAIGAVLTDTFGLVVVFGLHTAVASHVFLAAEVWTATKAPPEASPSEVPS